MFNIEDFLINNKMVSTLLETQRLTDMLAHTFTYEGLPDKTDKDKMELALIERGSALFLSDFTIATNYGKRDGSFIVDGEKVDGCEIRNTPQKIPAQPLLLEFATFTAHAKITALMSLINLRTPHIFRAKDENTYESILEFQQQLNAGNPVPILSEEIDTIEGMEYFNSPNVPSTALTELWQYLNAYYHRQIFDEDVHNNLKREYVSDSEIQKSTGSSFHDVMLETRRAAFDEINKKYGLNVKVGEFSDEDEISDNSDNETSEVGDVE